MKRQKLIYTLYLTVVILIFELALKLWCGLELTLANSITTLMLSGAIGMALTLICCARDRVFFVRFTTIFLFAVSLYFCTQAVYYFIFRTFLTVYSLTGVGAVLQNFGGQAIAAILNCWMVVLFCLAPPVLWLIKVRHYVPQEPVSPRSRTALGMLFCALQLAGIIVVMGSNSGVISTSYIYRDSFVPTLSVSHFGALTTLRLDLRELLLMETKTLSPDELAVETEHVPTIEITPNDEEEDEPAVKEGEEPVYGANVLEIDFNALIEGETSSILVDMHEYFSSRDATMQNEYTGYFEGKNLIWIVGESFSSLALDETHTPTLCKLASEGFMFNNFYNPLWGVSTSDGEYVTLFGLMPKTGVWSFSRSSNNALPFSLANLLSAQGYLTNAYHNHSYTYYDRNKSHPNLGYDYYGVGNGLLVTNQWPESDVEMIENTVDDYVNSSPFHIYYLTVSGHMNYNFYGNNMCKKHEEDVADLSYSDAARAYIACNMELDQAMEKLIEELDAAGVLDDTVIVLSGDHYPYGLTNEEIEELRGDEIDSDFELYESTLIIWNAAMENTVVVDKPCSSLDIYPTLLNLFGLDYDSRLIMGSDILSDSEPLVVLSNYSFLTEQGLYNSKTDTFTANEDANVDEEYARDILAKVTDMFKYSAAILDNNYYARIFGD